jgi:hypothetical protein
MVSRPTRWAQLVWTGLKLMFLRLVSGNIDGNIQLKTLIFFYSIIEYGNKYRGLCDFHFNLLNYDICITARYFV